MGNSMATIITTAVIVASCGGSSGGQPPASLGEAPATALPNDGESTIDRVGLDTRTAAASSALRAEHGDTGAAVAFLLGLERGYRAETVIDASIDGELTATGVIERNGDAVKPEGTPLGLFVLPDGPQGFRRAPTGDAPYEPVSLVDFLQQKMREGDNTDVAKLQVVDLLVELVRTGYDIDEIVATLVLGTAAVSGGPTCYSLTTERGGPTIRPRRMEVAYDCNSYALLAADDDERETTGSTSTAAPAVEVVDAVDNESGDSGRTEWAIEVPAEPTTDDEFGLTTHEPTKVLITRTPGTDTFIMTASTGRTNVDDRYTDDGFNEITCTREFGDVYSGTGSFDTEFSELIVFVGELFTKDVITDCDGGADNSFSRPDWEIVVRITPEGLSGGFYPAEFVIPGDVPVPIGD